MPHTHKIKAKAKKIDEVIEKAAPAKIDRKEFDLESAELLLGDKVEDVEAVEGEEEGGDEAAEVVDFDDEEINPFDDKWEE